MTASAGKKRSLSRILLYMLIPLTIAFWGLFFLSGEPPHPGKFHFFDYMPAPVDGKTPSFRLFTEEQIEVNIPEITAQKAICDSFWFRNLEGFTTGQKQLRTRYDLGVYFLDSSSDRELPKHRENIGVIVQNIFYLTSRENPDLPELRQKILESLQMYFPGEGPDSVQLDNIQLELIDRHGRVQ